MKRASSTTCVPAAPYRGLPSESMLKHGAEMGFEIPDVVADGEVIECDPPRKLVQTWRMLMDPSMAGETPSRLTWEINEGQGGVSKLTVVHELEGAPISAALVAGEMEHEGAGGGWNETLSALKTVLETGKTLHS